MEEWKTRVKNNGNPTLICARWIHFILYAVCVLCSCVRLSMVLSNLFAYLLFVCSCCFLFLSFSLSLSFHLLNSMLLSRSWCSVAVGSWSRLCLIVVLVLCCLRCCCYRLHFRSFFYHLLTLFFGFVFHIFLFVCLSFCVCDWVEVCICVFVLVFWVFFFGVFVF